MAFRNFFYYQFGEAETKIRKNLKLLIPLELPYIILSLTYIIFRFDELQKINLIFWIVLLFSSIWFMIGPRLVYKYISFFNSFQTNQELCCHVRHYFKENESKHFKIYIIYWIIEGLAISLIGVVPIFLYPNILTKNITYGRKDIFFWLIIIFIIWFLFYCANATSFISLIAFKIIRDLKNDKIFNYNPTSVEHHKSIEYIQRLCNKAVSYTCSGLVFIPLAIYFLLQQPEFVTHNNTYKIKLCSFQDPIYIIWVIFLLLFYCFFLFFFITYPNYELRKYINQKNNDYLLIEKNQYINNFNVISPTILFGQNLALNEQIYLYNIYLRLQEVKSICKLNFTFDTSIFVTYISIFVTLLSSIPGFVQIFRLL